MIQRRVRLPVRLALVAACGIAATLALAAEPVSQADTPDLPPTAIEAIDRACAYLSCDSPSSSNALNLDDAPPFPPVWHQMAAQAWEHNATARAIFRQAATRPAGHWPPLLDENGNPKSVRPSLNLSRRLANEDGDMALYAAFNGHPTEALNLIDDLGRLAGLMDVDPDGPDNMVRLLVGLGIDAVRTDQLRVVSTMLDLSPAAAEPVPRQRLSGLIDTLLRHPSADAVWDGLGDVRQAKEVAATQPDDMAAQQTALQRDRLVRTINRVHAERAMMAVGLACLLYHQDTGHWPESADALVPKYLAALPTDPFADPPAPIGYRLVKGGLPDGTDRPLVFSVFESGDGLSFTDTRPLYESYVGNGDTSPGAQNNRGKHGQFRDVAAWPPR